MLHVLAIILIQSSPLAEIAQGPQTPSSSAEKKAEKPFSLKGGKTIVVKQFSFAGNKAISAAQLQRLTNPYLNQSLSESNLSEIQQRIAILYKSRGYAQVEVTIPSRQQEGSITFLIKEGKKLS